MTEEQIKKEFWVFILPLLFFMLLTWESNGKMIFVIPGVLWLFAYLRYRIRFISKHPSTKNAEKGWTVMIIIAIIVYLTVFILRDTVLK
jgi:hypothetical protein